MIIEAKSTKQAAEPVDGRKQYETKAEKTSKLPLYFALAITAIAAYLKSAFPAHSEIAEDTGPASEGATARGSAPDGEHVSEVPGIAELIDDTETGSIDEAEPRNSIGRGLPWQVDYLYPDPPPLSFARLLDMGASLQVFFPVAFGFSPSNDNGSAIAKVAPVAEGGRLSASIPDSQDRDDHTDNGGDPDDDEDEDDDDEQPGANRAPVVQGPVRLHDVFAGQTILIALSQLLFGASDPDQDTLAAMNVTVTGATVTHTANGWMVETLPGMLGPVTFTYAVSDGQASVQQTASLQIVRHQVTLTPQDDVYAATPYDDDIEALAGDDIVDALAGNDSVIGGEGDDHINGGAGEDRLFGGNGDDVIFGGSGQDIIAGENGNDRLFGEQGDDVVSGGEGEDYLAGGSGDDILDGGADDDRLEGEDGDDLLAGAQGDDHLGGGTGNDGLDGGDGQDLLLGGRGDDVLDGGADGDTLAGGEGQDRLLGGSGNDTIVADAGDDVIDGGEGLDTVDLTEAQEDAVVDLIAGVLLSAELGEDSLTSIEAVLGGEGDDLFVVSASLEVTLTGGRGRDLFVFESTGAVATVSDNVVHEILDFVVGDRVRVKDYDISRQAENAQQDFFKVIYDDTSQDWLASDLPILVQYEQHDTVAHTIIRADMNRDTIFEVTIDIHGIHLPALPEYQIA